MKTLQSKLILAISLFIVVLFSITSFLQIQEKERELTFDIFSNTKSFAELTAPQIVEDYKLYLVPKSFIYFNREVQSIFAKNPDVRGIMIVDFQGNIVFDSQTENNKQYEGSVRKVEDAALLEQVRAKNPSVKTDETGRVVYLKNISASNYSSVDFNEKVVKSLAQDEKLSYLVQPYDNQYAVVYTFSYDALQQRIFASLLRTLILTLFGVALGILLSIIFSSSITKPLKKLREGAAILAQGNFTHRVEIKTKDELHQLADSFNTMAADLEKSMKALVYKERVAKELELAVKIQKQLLPKTVPLVKGLDLAAGIISAEEIGGDLYDFLRVDNDNLIFYLGDVTGHGVPSGIVGSIANALFFTFAGKKDPKEILIDVNAVLKEKASQTMFLTLVLMHWDAGKEKMIYISAGHEQIIHYKAKEKKVVLLPAGGVALGMIPKIDKMLQSREVDFQEDDILLIYSDGIPEAWRNEKEMYGMERLKEAVEHSSSFDSALAIRNAILSDVDQFREGYKQMDDITSIVVKRKKI